MVTTRPTNPQDLEEIRDLTPTVQASSSSLALVEIPIHTVRATRALTHTVNSNPQVDNSSLRSVRMTPMDHRTSLQDSVANSSSLHSEANSKAPTRTAQAANRTRMALATREAIHTVPAATKTHQTTRSLYLSITLCN